MQVADPLAHLIQQLDGPGRNPVRFVGSVIPVHASNMMRCRVDFKHLLGDAMRLCLVAILISLVLLVGIIVGVILGTRSKNEK